MTKIKFVGKHCVVEYEPVKTGHEALDKKVVADMTEEMCKELDLQLGMLHAIGGHTPTLEQAGAMLSAFCQMKGAAELAFIEENARLIINATIG